MTKPDISPLPWSHNPADFDGFIMDANFDVVVENFDKEEDSYPNAIANSNFIVEACNNYHRLIEENKALREQQEWVSVKDRLPDLLPELNYSANVLGWCNGRLGVFCLMYLPDEDIAGYCWCSCYGDINGDAENDDEYPVTHWKHLPTAPKEDGV